MLCLFCTNQEGIKEHLTKNCQKKNEEALPAYLMISPENIYMKVAGVTFGGRQRTVARLKSGQELVFIPEPSNPYDNHAVNVCTTGGEQIGYVAKEHNYQIFCNLMNKTGSYKVYVSNVTGGGMGSNYGCNIRVVYCQ